ncbi:apolipoprotein N-acyltransferase [Kitasatospora sp. NA04385]|uniref:apolipoprotein N-acyltransferase n=1 Tax=Kitasatospora sp. NA04385 TaxID=2742135 RepID=UPI0015902196|nr:apolipoprotein N-acyltransferase [Kitasatospora sp. NA04385]QKW18477.1 apolipoprotein N-acyltransferase [Kitasatospora sp. NA04385]
MALPVSHEQHEQQERPVAEQDAEPTAPGRGRRRTWWARTALAALSGLALALAFPPFDLWPLSVLAVAALALLTRGRTARHGAWIGFAFGVPFFVVLLSWLRPVGWDATVGLSLIEALFLALMGAGTALTSKLRGWPLWGAVLWVTQEWMRDRLPFGGFPWGRLAFANTASPFTPLAALGGAPLVTFAVAAAGTLLAWAALSAVRARRTDTEMPWRTGVGAVGALALVGVGYAVPVPTSADDTVKVALVQGNVDRPGMDFLGRPMEVLDNHATATEKLAADIAAGKADRPDVVIWPENASDLDPFTDPAAYARIDEAVKAVGVPTLVGALVDGPDEQHVQNEGIVWDPVTGPGASYTKQHPVPFGEYVPFRTELSKVISRLQRVARDFYPGTHNGVMQLGPARIGDVICFEVAYDEIVRDAVNEGGRVIVVQTNNATYNRTGQTEQQLAMSRLRAVEHGRAVLIAATSGVSAVITPDGTVEQRTGEMEQAVLNALVPLRDGRTVADRVGAAPEWVLAVGGVLACAFAATGAVRRRRAEGRAAAEREADAAA